MGFSEHISSQTSLDSIQCIQWVEKKILSRFFSLSNGINASNGGKKKYYPVFFRFPMDSMGFSEHISSQTSLDSIQCIQWVGKKTLSCFFRFPMVFRTYRVSQKKRPTLVLLIFQLSRGLRFPSWTFFNSPFHVEFKNVHLFIIW